MSVTTAFSAAATRKSDAALPLSCVDSCTIAMVAPSLDILGGQGVQARSLMEALRYAGFKVVFIPINPRFPRWLSWLRSIPFARTLVNQLIFIPTLLRLRRADVVHVFSASYWSFLLGPVPAILIARLCGKPVVLNYHSGEAEDHLGSWGVLVHPWLHLVDEIVVPSNYLQQVFSVHGYKTRVIRNMINTTHFRYRERIPLKPRLLSVRNLESHYCVENTLKAFALVKKKYPEATLTVAGYGSEEAALKAWVHAHLLQDVEFVGRVEPEAMPMLYNHSDILLNSSIVDNQPVSILEACAAGLFVISTPVGDIPAMIQDGVSGQLVRPHDPVAMAATIISALEQPSLVAPMTRRAREEAEKYTGPTVCREWADLYFTQSV